MTETTLEHPAGGGSPVAGLFAAGDRYTFVGQSHEVEWTIESVEDGMVTFGSPSGGAVKPPMRISADRLMIGLNERRAIKVAAANARGAGAIGENPNP
mgnify:FL=1